MGRLKSLSLFILICKLHLVRVCKSNTAIFPHYFTFNCLLPIICLIFARPLGYFISHYFPLVIQDWNKLPFYFYFGLCLDSSRTIKQSFYKSKRACRCDSHSSLYWRVFGIYVLRQYACKCFIF